MWDVAFWYILWPVLKDLTLQPILTKKETTFSCKTEPFHFHDAIFFSSSGACFFPHGGYTLTKNDKRPHFLAKHSFSMFMVQIVFFMGVFLSTWMLHVPAWGVVKTLHGAPFFLRAALECRRMYYLCNCIISTPVMVLKHSVLVILERLLMLIGLSKNSKLVPFLLCTTSSGPW